MTHCISSFNNLYSIKQTEIYNKKIMRKQFTFKKVFVLLSAMIVTYSSQAQDKDANYSGITVSPWKINLGDGEQVLPQTQRYNGDTNAYALMNVPAIDDQGWSLAPLDEKGDIKFGGSDVSILKGACLTSVDFTFFETNVFLPQGTVLDSTFIRFGIVDDGARALVYNSKYPSGAHIKGGDFIYQQAPTTADLSELLVIGENNRIVIAQFDDCAFGNNMSKVNVEVNGVVIEPSPIVVSPWYIHEGAGPQNFTTNEIGDPTGFELINVPAVNDQGWYLAKEDENGKVNYGSTTSSKLTTCIKQIDFTYLETNVFVPYGSYFESIKVSFESVDDAFRVLVFNSKNPNGGYIEGGDFKFGASPSSSNLSSLIAEGENNRIVIAQFDNCPDGNVVSGIKMEIDGAEIIPSKVKTSDWSINEGKGAQVFGVNGSTNALDYINVPLSTDNNWKPAPLDASGDIKFGGPNASILGNCGVSVDFTYFATDLFIPFGERVDSVTVKFGTIDDGARVLVFNSKYPSGAHIEGGDFALGDEPTSYNLVSLIEKGENNRIVIAQYDSCAVGNTLYGANVQLNGVNVNEKKNDVVTGIDKSESTSTIIYPNPAQEYFNILSEEEMGNVVIYNQMGQIVTEYAQSGKTLNVQTSNWTSGIYLVRSESKLIGKVLVK